MALFLILIAQAASAQNRADTERQFQVWLAQEIWPRAKAKGVSRKTFEAAFNGVALNWELPGLVPPGSKSQAPKQQSQAEFGAPAKYFKRSALEAAAATGERMAHRYASVLQDVEQDTGVPGRIILAIWGRESAYGQARIPHNLFEVLGTKGFMSTRAALFTDELIAALQIAEQGDGPASLKSSWAGAMGQPQFMPSKYLKYAVDGDGDGRADIWGSEADTLASIGHYLAQHGWDSGRDWGFEVTIPDSVSCALEGPDQGRLISDWAAMGVIRVSGAPFPTHELNAIGYLMMPAGRHGPAFIVTPNFYALKEYNRSDLYALFVGHVGDRIQYGMGDFAVAWEAVDKLFRSDVTTMQRALEGMGHDVGGADGLAGFKTRRSIGRWQAEAGQEITCFPNAAMKNKLIP